MTQTMTLTPQFRPKVKGYDHQVKWFEETKDKQYWALFWEMGTGKSKVIIDTLAHNFSLGKIDRALILAKKGEYGNWHYDQLPKHWPDELPYASVIYDSYKVHLVSFREEMSTFLQLPSDTMKFLIVNVESLNSTRDKRKRRVQSERRMVQRVLDAFFKSGKAALIADESTWAKDHQSGRSLTVSEYVPKAVLRRILSGTAVTESPMDLWGQHLLLKKGILGHSSFSSFRSEVCVREMQHFGPRSVMKTVGFKNLDWLAGQIKPWSNQVLKKDCLDLPDKIYDVRVVDLDEEHRRVYDKLKAEAMLELQGEEFEILHAMALSSKMHQLAAGQIKVGDEYHWQPTTKLDATLDILESHRGKAIIWCPYREPLRVLTETLKKEYGPERVGRFYGGVPDEEREATVKAFQEKSDRLRFIVANQQSMGFGRTLTEGTLNVYYADDYKLELRLQSEDRTHRIGQEEHVHYVNVVARRTVDELVVSALRRKRKISDEIMDRPATDWL